MTTIQDWGLGLKIFVVLSAVSFFVSAICNAAIRRTVNTPPLSVATRTDMVAGKQVIIDPRTGLYPQQIEYSKPVKYVSNPSQEQRVNEFMRREGMPL